VRRIKRTPEAIAGISGAQIAVGSPPMRTPTIVCATLLAVVWPAASVADEYDPLLDGEPPPGQVRPYAPPTPTTGFQIGASLFGYGGRARSRLEKRVSRLEPGVGGGVALSLGGRGAGRVEFLLEAGLGLGSRIDTSLPGVETVFAAYDLFVEPRILVAVARGDRAAFHVGLGPSLWAFDTGEDGVSQLVFGPALVLAGTRRLDARSLLFLELTTTFGWDFFAYERFAPSAEALALDPSAPPRREDGQFAPVARLSIGYRLSGF
jgi:hypothetical protein